MENIVNTGRGIIMGNIDTIRKDFKKRDLTDKQNIRELMEKIKEYEDILLEIKDGIMSLKNIIYES